MLKTLLLIILIYMVYQYVLVPMFQGWLEDKGDQPEIHNDTSKDFENIDMSDIQDVDYKEIDESGEK